MPRRLPIPALNRLMVPRAQARLMDSQRNPYSVQQGRLVWRPVGVSMTQTYPVLPLRDIVVFPHMIVPLFVGRDKSVAALEAAMAADKEIFLVAQLDPAEDDPAREDLYEIGVTATVLQLLKLPDGTVRVLVEGKERGRLNELTEDGEF